MLNYLFQVPGYSQWFNIKFEGDQAMYTYTLLKDYIHYYSGLGRWT